MGARSPHRKVRTLVAVGAAIVIVGAGATAAFATTRSSGHAYRTAAVTHGVVARQLRSSGTIQPVAQASVAFPVAGTVATVDVAVGAQVTVGQQLATLDATSYRQAVIAKEAQLAAAKLTLYKALNGESTSGNGSSRGTSNANPTTNAASTNASTNQTAGAQQQLLVAQQQVDAALATGQTALASANKACGTTPTTAPATSPSNDPPATGPRQPSQPTGAIPHPSSTTTSTTVAAGSKPASSGLGSAPCIAAQQQLFTDQQALAAAQLALAQAEQAFERALSSSSASAQNGKSNGAATTATSPSAAQLIADQAAVDAAATAVLAAQEAVAQATITSPIAGTVAAVNMQVGHTVTASSTTATIVVVGRGGYEVATTVGVNDIAKVKVGDAATVVPDATSTALKGKVVWVGAASGSGSSTTYSVVIGLSGSPTGLRNGAMASTSIELARSKTSALVVPTSAVHTTNAIHLVTVLTGGKTSAVPVQIGVVGVETTQITSGLEAGQLVVLADLHAAVPSSNTSSRIANAITGGGGGGLGGGSTFVRRP